MKIIHIYLVSAPVTRSAHEIEHLSILYGLTDTGLVYVWSEQHRRWNQLTKNTFMSLDGELRTIAE